MSRRKAPHGCGRIRFTDVSGGILLRRARPEVARHLSSLKDSPRKVARDRARHRVPALLRGYLLRMRARPFQRR